MILRNERGLGWFQLNTRSSQFKISVNAGGQEVLHVISHGSSLDAVDIDCFNLMTTPEVYTDRRGGLHKKPLLKQVPASFEVLFGSR